MILLIFCISFSQLTQKKTKPSDLQGFGGRQSFHRNRGRGAQVSRTKITKRIMQNTKRNAKHKKMQKSQKTLITQHTNLNFHFKNQTENELS